MFELLHIFTLNGRLILICQATCNFVKSQCNELSLTRYILLVMKYIFIDIRAVHDNATWPCLLINPLKFFQPLLTEVQSSSTKLKYNGLGRNEFGTSRLHSDNACMHYTVRNQYFIRSTFTPHLYFSTQSRVSAINHRAKSKQRISMNLPRNPDA